MVVWTRVVVGEMEANTFEKYLVGRPMDGVIWNTLIVNSRN